MTEFSFDPDAARPFLKAIYQGPDATDGLIELITEDDDHKLTGKARFDASQIEAAILYAEVATQRRSRVYFGAGVRRPDLEAAVPSKNEDVLSWSALVWDFDRLEDAQFGLQRAEEIGLPFHFVVQTGEVRNHTEADLRIQCWVLLDKPCTDLGLVSQALRTGISVFGSDKSIHDPRRIMRLPGSVSWGLKDGRVDERVILRPDLSEPCPRMTIEAVLALLADAEPAPVKTMSDERVAEIVERIGGADGAMSLWRDSPMVNTFINDLMEGVIMNPSLFGLASAAANDGHDPETILAHLRLLLQASEGQATRPDRCAMLDRDLGNLVRRAVRDAGLGSQAVPYAPATEELPAVVRGAPEDDLPFDAREKMWRDSIWVAGVADGIVFDLGSRELMKKRAFDKLHNDVGDPVDARNCATAVFLREYPTDHEETPGRCVTVQRLTYRPGGALVVREPDGATAVNTWTPSPLKPATAASDGDIKPYLDLVNHALGEHAGHFFDYMAYLLQFPGTKINHAILVKSCQGLGKGLMMVPIIAALGAQNCAEVGPHSLASDFNSWLDRKKLIVVDEMQTTERKNAMNKLKTMISSPPDMLQINKKGIPEYEVPNLVSLIFFSNLDSPVLLERGDRRFFVIDSDALPLSAERYAALVEWYGAGGVQLVARWLLSRSVAEFDARGRAPETDAKVEMTKDGRTAVEEWIEDGIADAVAPFDTDVICLQDVHARLRIEEKENRLPRGSTPSGQKLFRVLARYGALALGERVRVNIQMAHTDNRANLFAIRRHSMLLGELKRGGVEAIRTLFVTQYEKAAKARIANEFAAHAAG